MKTDAKKQLGVVVESYDHDALHSVLIVRSGDLSNHYFFFIHKTPQVDFGDIIQTNSSGDTFYVCRGNSKLTYKINPLTFPGDLLWELITERLNQ